MTDRMTGQRPTDENRNLARRDESQYGVTRYGNWSPFELMRRFTEDVDRMFNTLGLGAFGSPFDTMSTWGTTTGASMWTPSVDVLTRGDDLVVTADLPGVKPEDVQIEADDTSLIIRGESRQERQRDEKGYYYSERSYGNFYRRIPLPPGVNANNATAQFNNGVLEVMLPGAVKQLQPERRHIPIQGAPTQSTQYQQQQPTGNTEQTQTTTEQSNA